MFIFFFLITKSVIANQIQNLMWFWLYAYFSYFLIRVLLMFSNFSLAYIACINV